MKDCREACADLVSEARQFGVALDSEQQEKFVAYCRAIRDVSRHTNVTGVNDSEGIVTVLFLESLRIEMSLQSHFGERVEDTLRLIDVGSGAGIPGLPLLIAHPMWSVTLVESVGKKARFIGQTARNLGVTGAHVEARRSEELAGEAGHRDAYDVAVARAVAPLATLLELCAPFVRPGGALLFPKSGDLGREIEQAGAAQHVLGIRGPFPDPEPSASAGGNRKWVVRYEKVAATPPGFPRRAGLARSAPLVKANVEKGAARLRVRKEPRE